MWKRLIIVLVTLIGFCSIGYVYSNMNLDAASAYNVGSSVTMKLGEKGIGPGGPGSMVKGDKVYVGSNTASGNPMSFILLLKETYKTYQPQVDGSGVYSLDTSVPNITGWFAMQNEVYTNTPSFTSYPSVQMVGTYTMVEDYLTSEPTSVIASELRNVNTNISNKTKKILINRNFEYLQLLYNERNSQPGLATQYEEFLHYGLLNPQSFFIGDRFTLLSISGSSKINVSGGYHLSNNDLVFVQDYFVGETLSAGSDLSINADLRVFVFSSAGNVIYDTAPKCTKSACSSNTTSGLRLSAELDLSDVVFATGMGSGSTYAKVKNSSPDLSGSYSNIYTATSDYDKLKLRLLDDTGAHSIIFNDIENKNTTTISKAVKDSSIYLDANAAAGSSDGDVNTVSALFFKNNELAYYIPVATANGADKYELDLSGIDEGKYKIALVNEGYNESSMAPAESSALSAYQELEIVKTHKLTYTKAPQSGASAGNDYEFSKNVNAGQTVGKVTINPQGIMPLTYSVESNGDNTYQNFEIDGLNSSGASSSTSLNVKIKSNAPDLVNGGLKAGDYKFCVSAVDANGDPTAATSDSKVCTSFTVEKTNLTVAFDDSNQTKKSITDAATVWNESATATPNNSDVKITYSKVGGDIGLIDIDSDTGAITYKGNGAYGKVKIRATADDDPSSGNNNYNSAYAEKEIVVYAEVNGSVTPHANSSDISTPTFSANDPNIKINGTIGTIKGSPGTPDDVTGSRFTYTYGLKTDGDGSFFAVNASTGVITTKANLAVGSYTITVTVSDKWSTKEIPVTINVGMAAAEDLKFYENSSSNVAITTKSAKATDTNVTVYATVKGSSNSNPVKYSIKDGSTNIIEINEDSGSITIHGVGTVTIVAEKQGGIGQANATAELTFTVTAGSQNFIYTDNAGNELPKDGSSYKAYSEVYAQNKTFQLYTAGNPTGSSVTYQLKAGSPTDVISVDANGLVTILNASLNNQMGKVIVQATSHDSSGNYSDKTIELPINIEKGTRVITFAENPIYVVNGKGKVEPVIEVDGVVDTSGDVLIEVDSNEDHTIAWTNDNKVIDYNYSGETGKDIKIHATKPMDRNYKVAEADGTIHIMGPDENVLAITSPGQIIYGDHFTIKSTQYDADSTNVQYTFEIDDTTYISNPTVTGNKAEFDAIKNSGSKKTTITVTRTADGESPLSKKVQVTVLPKPIEITIDDQEKYKGEQNPSLTYQDFKNQLVTWNGVQDVIQANDIKLSTTAKTSSNAGSYPIKGDITTLNKTYPNYSFTFKEGTLTIKEDNIEDDWYHLEINDGKGTTYTGKWTNQDVNIISDHAEYINLSLDQSTWKINQVTVSKEGETNQSFWMKKDSGAITKEKQEIIKIDKTPPKVKGIKANDTNNKLQDIIHQMSYGFFFKPGTAFEITTSDVKDDLKVSGTKEISYTVYKLDTTARSGEELIKEGKLTVTKEKANITISETTGKYKVCVIPTDNAGNTNAESCHEVELKKIDVDVDGDGKPDFNDPDGDGCPDLNIKWKDPENPDQWITINGDRNNDKIPDLNIDSDGDGVPDLNIDTDHDGKPDLNLVILKKTDWKPTKCVKADPENNILEEYCTGTSVKAVINVDTDDDGIPNINIDTNGDMKADFNIAKDQMTPSINIGTVHTPWTPKKDYAFQGFSYDTDIECKPYLNVDTNGDGSPDVNVDIDGDGKPDINIDIDGDGIPDTNIDGDGDGKPDINVDTDGDGTPDENIKDITEWKPNKNVDGDVPYDTMIFDETKEPDTPNEPSKPTNPDDPKPERPDQSGNDTDVKGVYYPGNSIGGALTADYTVINHYIFACVFGMSVMCVLLYKKNKDKASAK